MWTQLLDIALIAYIQIDKNRLLTLGNNRRESSFYVSIVENLFLSNRLQTVSFLLFANFKVNCTMYKSQGLTISLDIINE